MNTTPNICFYFQVHQPYRLRDLRITDIGHGSEYFDWQKNHDVFRKVAEKCYLPANALMLELLKKYPEFHVSYSLSGVFLEQCNEYGHDVFDSFKKLAATGKVEFLAETYYHSLSAIHSIPEFCEQVAMHVRKIEELFGQKPQIFRNTELIFNNEIAHTARMMGFRGTLAEGADHILQGRSPNEPYAPPEFYLPEDKYWNVIRQSFPGVYPPKKILVLLKNYKLSDDVAFRFSDRSWIGFPLRAETFTDWVIGSGGHNINLFMDYETFGEHQWKDTGIFEFLRKLPELWQDRGIRALTPSQVLDDWEKKTREPAEQEHLKKEAASILAALSALWKRPGTVQSPLELQEKTFDAHLSISWADTERDLSAWNGNQIQSAALQALYELEKQVKASGNEQLIRAWRLLQTSDHFYYMCTKYWNDGDVHKYFSPYESPYEAYRRFSHALCDLRSRLHL